VQERAQREELNTLRSLPGGHRAGVGVHEKNSFSSYKRRELSRREHPRATEHSGNPWKEKLLHSC
jgi:hypothetical protein